LENIKDAIREWPAAAADEAKTFKVIEEVVSV